VRTRMRVCMYVCVCVSSNSTWSMLESVSFKNSGGAIHEGKRERPGGRSSTCSPLCALPERQEGGYGSCPAILCVGAT